MPGPAREALALAIRALEAVEFVPVPMLQARALADVAHAYRALGALDVAQSHLQQALRWARCLGADAEVELLCELAELAVAQAAQVQAEDRRAAHAHRERARDHAFEAATLACRAADAHWEVHVLLRVSDALDRCGDHSDAIALQCRALHLLSQDEAPALNADPRGDAPLAS
jgi:tetratricopeptide (TPR) repeat protein